MFNDYVLMKIVWALSSHVPAAFQPQQIPVNLWCAACFPPDPGHSPNYCTAPTSEIFFMPSPAIVAIDHVQLAVPRGAESTCRPFFVDILGLREIEKPPALRDRGGLWFQGAGIEIHLGVDPDFRPARKAHPAFRVTGLDALAARIAAAGLPVVRDEAIAGRQRFFTEDPVGNRLEFLEI
jgi:catechol 2,3-dioxygenase-like lactoylglutathione lyase family enzyme